MQNQWYKSPFTTNAGFDSLITMMVLNNELIEVKDGPLYLKSLKHSPSILLVPEAFNMVDGDMLSDFQQSLRRKSLKLLFSGHRFAQEETQKAR